MLLPDEPSWDTGNEYLLSVRSAGWGGIRPLVARNSRQSTPALHNRADFCNGRATWREIRATAAAEEVDGTFRQRTPVDQA